jgi:acetyl esterase/lipase
VVLIHGGFWRERWDRTLMTPLAHDLAGRGIAAWNVEYRRVGQEGGGWPGTLEDVAAALDAVADLADVDSTRVATCGHSAGGQLALWLAARATERVTPRAAVALAGVCDLTGGARAGLGGHAVEAFLGGRPDEVPERYAAASPTALVPTGIEQLLVHGAADDIVPLSQSHGYDELARASGDTVTTAFHADGDHFDVIDPTHEMWRAAATWLRERLVV